MSRPMSRSLVTSMLDTGMEASTEDASGRAGSNASDPSTVRKLVRYVEKPMYSSEKSTRECTESIVHVESVAVVMVSSESGPGRRDEVRARDASGHAATGV